LVGIPVNLLRGLTMACMIAMTATPTARAVEAPRPQQQQQQQQQPAKVIGYFAEWTNYTADQIPSDLVTHVNYAFGVIRDGKCAIKDKSAAMRKFAQLRALKQKHPHVQTLISVGGWTDSGPFSDAAATEESRKIFARSCADFAHEQGFDGVDIDWEFPGGGGFEKDKWRKEDTQNFTALLADLRSALDAQGKSDGKRYLLTIAAPAGPNHYSKIELATIHPLLDAINLMTYDFAGFWSERTNFNAPLFAAPNDPAGAKNNADAAVRGYLAAGVPAEKIVLGVPFYGRAWAGVKDVNHGLYQPHGKSRPKATGSGDEWSYRSIAQHYLGEKQMPRYWSDDAKVPWIFDATEGLMVSYDDPQSLELKAKYARDKHLGGVMIWELSEDDERSSLLTALNAGLRGR
jgi:chitinase